jgi:hypothetical protein
MMQVAVAERREALADELRMERGMTAPGDFYVFQAEVAAAMEAANRAKAHEQQLLSVLARWNRQRAGCWLSTAPVDLSCDRSVEITVVHMELWNVVAYLSTQARG